MAKPQVIGPFLALGNSKRGRYAPFTEVLQLALLSSVFLKSELFWVISFRKDALEERRFLEGTMKNRHKTLEISIGT